MGSQPEDIIRLPARVIAGLRPGILTVSLGHRLGMADGGVPTEIPLEIVPFDLRMPNSEFTVLFDRSNQQFVGVEWEGT